MSALYKAPIVKVETKNGEIQMSITLDINLNLTGADVQKLIQKQETNTENKKNEIEWEIPDFQSSEKINFGKLL